VIVASMGGAPHDPAWAHNLRAEPRATLRIASTDRAVVADEVKVGPERDRLWQLVCEAFPLYASYQRKTTRLIPLFVLDFERSE
jgi:deazaflavin-dependent oxidoreductase (nitroreductase family)